MRARLLLLLLLLAPLGGCLDWGVQNVVAPLNPEVAYVTELRPSLEETAREATEARGALEAFRAGDLSREEALAEVREAQASLRETRAEVAERDPPPRFREAHEHLLDGADHFIEGAERAERCLDRGSLLACRRAQAEAREGDAALRAAREALPPEWRTLTDSVRR